MTVRFLKSLIMAFLCLAFFAACTRPGGQTTSRLVIQVPASLQKVGALSIPANRKACWGANITGPGISGDGASTCSPGTGVTAGYAVSGETISAQVLKGSDRKIDLYLYLLAVNDESNCPGMAAVFPPGHLTSIFLMGSATTDFVDDTTEVEITATYPGDANHLAAALAMPTTCTGNSAVAGTPPPFQISPAQDKVANASYTLRARVGIGNTTGVLSNGTYKLKLK